MPEEPPRSTRSFIAIHIPAVLTEKIVAVQTKLQGLTRTNSVRWTQPEQMHITMKFLGSVPIESLAALQSTLAEAVIGSAPFALSLEALGCFPSSRDPNPWVTARGN
jgi:2'-5' RNA ligase